MVQIETMASTRKSMLVGADRPDFMQSETMVDMFDHAVSLHVDRIAIRFSDANFTYSHLSSASHKIAALLLDAGVKPGDRVGLWCARGPLIPAAMIGIMRVGAAYVPFDSNTPAARLEAGCLDAGIDVLLHDTSTAPQAIALPFQRIMVEVSVFSAKATVGSSPPGQPLNAAEPNGLAYISFTSGSSGRPKGVMVAHSQVCHWIRSNHSITGIRQSDIVYQGASPAFDTSIEEIWSTFLVGAELIIADDMAARDPHEIVHLLNRHRATIMHTVPSLAALMEPRIPTLRLLNLGGEAVNPSLVELWARPGLRIINTYGPTEGTVSCTLAELSPGQDITIGSPLPNYRIYIVGDDNALAPFGKTGEIWIGGPSVTSGYIGRPDLTEERFGIDPFVKHPDPSQRIYRTGDNARIGNNGEILFLGRRDGQVKIRGYRVELEEIETVLTEMACVQWAAVVPQTHDNGDVSLIAYLVGAPDQALRLDDIRLHLKQRVAPYMVPHRFQKVDDLPRLSSGKVDRQLLASEAIGQALTHQNENAELSFLEQRMADVLKPLIGQESIGPTADFFEDLGAHSLLMARFVSQLRRSADLARLSMRDVYGTRNLRALAELVEPRLKAELAKANEPQAEMFIDRQPSPFDRRRYLFCAIGQGLSLLVIYGILAAALVTPYFAYALADEWYDDFATSCGLCIFSTIAISIALFYLTVATKWVVIGRYKAGDYPLWGSYYFRCWLVETILQLSPLQFLSNSPLYNHALRLLGVKIGGRVNLGSLDIGAFDLVSIGDGASFGSSVLINNRVFEDNLMRLRPILCGRNVHIGSVVT
jgi:amino acid adenylation domain-containing protein